jgi:hypothetical protein
MGGDASGFAEGEAPAISIEQAINNWTFIASLLG